MERQYRITKTKHQYGNWKLRSHICMIIHGKKNTIKIYTLVLFRCKYIICMEIKTSALQFWMARSSTIGILN